MTHQDNSANGLHVDSGAEGRKHESVEFVRVESCHTKGADMSSPDTHKALPAEERSQQTRSFVHRLRSVARRRYTPEQKIRIVGG